MTPDTTIEFHRDPDEIGSLREAWQSLCERSETPNVFYTPWMFQTALTTLASDDERIRSGRFGLVTAWSGNSRHPDDLRAILPVTFRRTGLTRRREISLFRYFYCSLCTPLLDARGADSTIGACLSWFMDTFGKRWTLALPLVDHSSLFAVRLRQYCEAGGFSFEEQINRRHCVSLLAPESVLSAVSNRRRREQSRRERRLAERGTMAIYHGAEAQTAATHIGRFLDLEVKGWKGGSGSAFRTSPGAEAFFTRVFQLAASVKAIRQTTVLIDSEPIAMLLSLVSGDTSFAFRIAYDEAFAKYSPGQLVAREHLVWLASDPLISVSDSCADPPTELIRTYWPQQKMLSSFKVTPCRR